LGDDHGHTAALDDLQSRPCAPSEAPRSRKLAVLCWHLVIKGEDYAFASPSLTERKLELHAAIRGR
jgi:hypothetical protein